MDAPSAHTERAELVCTDTVTNDPTITTKDGMPMESVSLSAGSLRST